MYYTREYLNRAHREIDTIFRVLFPEHGMAVREEQIMLCHKMLDNLLGRNIALCDAGVGIGKTYAYLVACVLMRKYSLLAEGCSPYEQRPVVISTSSIALQKAILTEYIPVSYTHLDVYKRQILRSSFLTGWKKNPTICYSLIFVWNMRMELISERRYERKIMEKNCGCLLYTSRCV